MNIEDYLKSNSWPFEEAKKIKDRTEKLNKKVAVFETGYGPSGLPHIGTFGEVFRTTLVLNAFKKICPIPTKLICFSDDMDGLRKVPDNIPNKQLIEKYIGFPLTSIPDPFNEKESFGDYMNQKLKSFLDNFGFEYEFLSSTRCYKQGMFNFALQKILETHDKVLEIMLPHLGQERQRTYSPFMPIDKKSGKVLQTGVESINANKGTLIYKDEEGAQQEISVFDGNVKLQWKPDFGMRWSVLNVDYEIFGKEHHASSELYTSICKLLGSTPPINFVYELFLDEKGEKISKSKGNGISIDDWLKYGTNESLALFMFQSPKKAKRLYFDVIPKSVDEYLLFAERFFAQNNDEKLNNPAFHIHNANVPKQNVPINFSMLLNLASACNPENDDVLWGFVQKYEPNINKDSSPTLAKLITHAISYYNDFVKPNKKFRLPTEKEKAAIEDLKDQLSKTNLISTDDLQTLVFSIGKKHQFENLADWFSCLYQVLLGQNQGPKMGSFIAIFGKDNFIELIDSTLSN